MKSVRFSLLNKKFDDQYTFELQGHLSVQDFCSTFSLLNESVRNNPPPGNKFTWIVSIWILWLFAIIGNYFLWTFTKSSSGLVVLPFFMMLTTLLFLWRHRVVRQKFEHSIVGICNRINATENIRGVNYRFSKNGSDIADFNKQLQITSNSPLKTVYSIVIEFDDRYNTLSSQQYNRHHSIDFVAMPLDAHLHNAQKDKKSGLFPTWSDSMKCQQQQYDEKFIIQYH